MIRLENIVAGPVVSITLRHSVTLSTRVVHIGQYASVDIADEEYIGTHRLIDGMAQAGQLSVTGTLYPLMENQQIIEAAGIRILSTDTHGAQTSPVSLDAGGVKGGPAALPIVTSDPGSPALNDAWILRTPAVAATQLTGSAGAISVSAITLSANDLLSFAAVSGYAVGFADNATAGVHHQTDGLTYGYSGSATLADFATAVNAWAQANLSHAQNIITIAGGQGGTLLSSIAGGRSWVTLTSNGVAEGYTLKVQGTNQVFTAALV
jgi:hypothetical protein